MLRRLYRQRRRILFLIACVLGALAIAGVDMDALRYAIKHEAGGRAGIHITSIVIAFLVVAVGAATIVLVVLPALRRSLECVGLTAIVVEIFKLVGAGWLPESALGAGALPFWYMGVYFVIATLLEKDAFFKRGLRLPFMATERRNIRASQAQIWAATAPDSDHLHTYASGLLTRVTLRPDLGPDTVEAHYCMGGSASLVQIQERLVWSEPGHLRYRFEPAHSPNDVAAIRGTYEMVCIPGKDGTTKVTVTHDYPGIGLGSWLLVWLDDLVSSEMDALQAHLEGRRDYSTVGWAKRKMAAS